MNAPHLYSRRNLDFMLYEVHDVQQFKTYSFYQDHDRETIDLILDTADNIAERWMRSALSETDKHPPQLKDGHVKVHPSTHPFYHAFSESGLLSSTFEKKYGGMQLPRSVFAAVDFIIGSAHNGFEMYTGLSIAAARLILSYGNEELINQYALPIINGQWAATMCLTETQAGSALADILTEAVETTDGSYLIQGQKIFISAGDHDLTENIVHLVLARKKNAPAGVKGISLFVVPKKIKSTQNELIDNNVTSVSIYHKMGQQSTPAMHLEFGTGQNCKGYLVGEENQGLKYMFQMMNSSRLGVGLAGTYIASAAYYTSLQYAGERLQGRRFTEKDPLKNPIPIIQHPDVRRLLLQQKTFVEGSLSFIIQCHIYQDIILTTDSEEKRNHYQQLLDLLTPVVKVYGSEGGNQSVHAGLQILGGYGYTSDFILEQLARDVRIMSIYEGTTGIQSQTLLGRQILGSHGRILDTWRKEINKDLDAASETNDLKTFIHQLKTYIDDFNSSTITLVARSKSENAELIIAVATPYMEWFSLLNVGWQWIKSGQAAYEGMNQTSKDDTDFYRSKIQTMNYFFQYELPRIHGLQKTIEEADPLTLYSETEILI